MIKPDELIENMTVGMQQRVEILKMLYRENEILIFDEPTAVLTPQEIDELMSIMRKLVKEDKSIIFITHKLNEIKEVADRCTVLRKGKGIGTVDVETTTKEEMSEMMVGRKIDLKIDKALTKPGKIIFEVENLSVISKWSKKKVVNNVSLKVRQGEIVCIAGIDGNGQSDLVYALTGIGPHLGGKITLNGEDITDSSIRHRNKAGMAHIPEDRHKYGLILDYKLSKNLVLKKYFEEGFQKNKVINYSNVKEYSDKLIEKYDVRTGQGSNTLTRSMSGGNQQKAILAREIEENPEILIAVQPTRGLDVGAIEYIHKQLVKQRDAGRAILLISLELDEVMNLSDKILVIYEGEIVAALNPEETNIKELGLYMAGSKRSEVVS
jgi:simple sugar transport system ATP-binding protein